MLRYLVAFVLATTLLGCSRLASTPLKVLLITGGCCHDYKTQKDIIKSGLEARVNCVVEHIHVDDKSTKPPFPHHGNPEYAKGFDLVIHDECAAAVQDPAIIDAVLKPHLVDGLPAINLHCAMHSYRFGDIGKPVTPTADNAKWFLYLGLQSTRHGPQEPIAITYTDTEHPITKGLAGWTTIKEELYNNIALHGGHVLAKGKQKVKDTEVENVVAWTNEVGPKKAKIFSTSIGHNNDTVADARYLDMIARAVLWTTGHINPDGTAAAGYGKK